MIVTRVTHDKTMQIFTVHAMHRKCPYSTVYRPQFKYIHGIHHAATVIHDECMTRNDQWISKWSSITLVEGINQFDKVYKLVSINIG